MSNSNTISPSTQLFTDLTPEEGASVAGGATFTLHSVYAANAKKQDDLYIKFDGKKIFGTRDMDTRDFVRVEKGYHFEGWSQLQAFDEDGWFNSDDYLGGRWVLDRPVSNEELRVTGKGYDYTIKYSITA